MEIWSGAWTTQALSSAQITVTFSGTVDESVVGAIAVSGTVGNGCSWDSHAGASVQELFTNGIGASYNQTTSQADDLLIIIVGGQVQTVWSSGGALPTFGGTAASSAGSANNALGSLAAGMVQAYLGVSSAGTIADVPKNVANGGAGCNAGGTCNQYSIADALTSDAAGGKAANMLLLGVGP